ncbi:hypothetical protein T01_6471 [Trichinella spiralis]|uniref:Uncharacterized protein n=1 Tax=Trichinella spiralis TaxID=6334 RepID=A0A0V1BPM7_TRISP|nr:hypothetical protein T01_6471 [Trichinella spiralis]
MKFSSKMSWSEENGSTFFEKNEFFSANNMNLFAYQKSFDNATGATCQLLSLSLNSVPICRKIVILIQPLQHNYLTQHLIFGIENFDAQQLIGLVQMMTEEHIFFCKDVHGNRLLRQQQ